MQGEQLFPNNGANNNNNNGGNGLYASANNGVYSNYSSVSHSPSTTIQQDKNAMMNAQARPFAAVNGSYPNAMDGQHYATSLQHHDAPSSRQPFHKMNASPLTQNQPSSNMLMMSPGNGAHASPQTQSQNMFVTPNSGGRLRQQLAMSMQVGLCCLFFW
jgi:hypothetical protein